jgi:hypothetical protein
MPRDALERDFKPEFEGNTLRSVKTLKASNKISVAELMEENTRRGGRTEVNPRVSDYQRCIDAHFFGLPH